MPNTRRTHAARILSAGVLVAIGLGAWAYLDSTTGGAIGVAVSTISLFVAIAIFLRQGVDSKAHNSRVLSKLDQIAGFAERALDTPPQPEECAARGEDVESDPSSAELDEAFRTMSQSIGDGAQFIDAANIPLRVIHDLVAYWQENDERGHWKVGNLIGAFQRPGTNTASVIVFQNSDDRARAWRLSRGGRGGRGKHTPTIVEVTPKP